MKKYNTIILGSGVGGLGSGCWLKEMKKDFVIIEKLNETPMNLHNGVHYLHSVPKLPFQADLKEITLTDGVLTKEGSIRHYPELQDALEYSEKVRAIQHPSSIYEVGTKHSVWIPKSNSMNDYIKEMVKFIGLKSFMLNSEIVSIDLNEKIITLNRYGKEEKLKYENLISTIPLRAFIEMSKSVQFIDVEFKSTPIEITNFKVNKIVPNWLINIYVPSKEVKPYRMSILNNNASIESIDKIDIPDFGVVKELFKMFHIDISDHKEYTWWQGKIISLDFDTRERILNYFIPLNVFFIGRFGVWNNKLLMDSTINQASEVCKYISIEKKHEFDTKQLIKELSK